MSWQFQRRKIPLHRSLGAMCMVAGLWGGAAGAADLVEPAVFASSNGVLDILMIAKASPVPNLAFTPPDGSAAVNPTGWVYEICKRKGSETSCPAGTGTVADYGGVRLALNQGEIEFSNVSFAYEPQNPVLKGVSLTVPSGKMHGPLYHPNTS